MTSRKSITVAPFHEKKIGFAPTAVALSPDAKTLFVALGASALLAGLNRFDGPIGSPRAFVRVAAENRLSLSVGVWWCEQKWSHERSKYGSTTRARLAAPAAGEPSDDGLAFVRLPGGTGGAAAAVAAASCCWSCGGAAS